MAAVVTAPLLAACTANAAGAPTPTATTREPCTTAVETLVDAVRTTVAGYEVPLTAAASPGPTPVPSQVTGGGSPDDQRALQDAVAAARATRQQHGCASFDRDLTRGLDTITPQGPVADAVWRRLSATLLGTVEQSTGDTVIAAGTDLRDAVAHAAAGSVIALPAGVLTLTATLVLLDAVTLRGAGRDATVIHSEAPNVGVLVAGSAAVRLTDLSLAMTGSQAASGIVAGTGTTLALTRTRISGAKADQAGDGGAGVYLSGARTATAGADTTFEATDAVFATNQWAGVAVAGSHRVSIQASRFERNGKAGLLFLDAAGGSVVSSTFTSDGIGIAVSDTAAPTLKSNTVTGGSVGVQTDSHAAPVIDGLRVSAADKASLIIGGDSRGWIGGVSCSHSPYGMIISAGAAPTLGSNTCPLQRGGS